MKVSFCSNKKVPNDLLPTCALNSPVNGTLFLKKKAPLNLYQCYHEGNYYFGRVDDKLYTITT